MEQNNEANSASVQHLQALYTTVVGLGLALAMAELIQPGREHIVDWHALPVLAAYLVTLVPFYHGALRHLDEAYLHHGAAGRKHAGLLLTDFAVLFMESCILFALAAFLSEPRAFGWALVLLLAIDTVWGVLFDRATTEHGKGSELVWAKINAVALVGLVIALLIMIGLDLRALAGGLILLSLATARSAVDYTLSWRFYFPSDSS